MSDHLDLLVVGAGPAGMRAAIEAQARGLTVAVLDEGQAAGGQIYRGAANGPFAGTDALGTDHARGARLAACFAASGARLHAGTSVFMVERTAKGGFLVGGVTGEGPARLFEATTLIIATGAHERPMPIPGWTLPGVMTAGAAQTLLKASALVPEGPLVLAGMGPLLYLLAAQYARLGVRVEAMVDTTPAANWRQAARHLPAFAASAYAWKGLALMATSRRGTRVFRRAHDLRAIGDSRLESLRFRAGEREHEIAARVLLLHQGVVPQVNLTMAAGAAHLWNTSRRAFEPVRNGWLESTVEGLFIAGDTGGVDGVGTAEAEGALAALGAVCRLGHWRAADGAIEAGWRRRHRTALRGRAFIDALYRPDDRQTAPADEVIVCRCEEVTAGEIREAVRRGAVGPNQVKAFTRAGMGPCQARMCGLTTHAIVAAEAGVEPGTVGYMRPRMPVKPVTVGQMAGLGGQ